METPAHVLINLILLMSWKPQFRGRFWYIFWGSVVPDIPFYLFLLLTRLYIHFADEPVWTQLYLNVHWHNFVDFFHSIPFISILLVIALLFKQYLPSTFFLCMLLHTLMDIPFLGDGTGHRILIPFSQWSYDGPLVDYAFACEITEFLLTLGLTFYLWKKDLLEDKIQTYFILFLPFIQGLIFVFNAR